MQRITFAGSSSLLALSLCLAAAAPALAQDRAGAAMAGGQAVQPPPPPPAGGGGGGGVIPPGGVMPQPPAGGGGGGGVIPPGVVPPGGAVAGVGVGIVGNIGIGAIAVTPPPPIGYYAPARTVDWNMGKFFYYPFYYFPHSYWPTASCPWPERPGEPYVRPPAYMAYPPFLEPHWRYEWYVPQKYYRGFHFWLDQF
jgi:F0F1-type ATP synthase membrane subunit c/vacuolar-type H+-ATPase subunit K